MTIFSVAGALRAAGWLSGAPDELNSQLAGAAEDLPTANLLTWLDDIWQFNLVHSNRVSRRRWKRLKNWCEGHLASGAQLTMGLPAQSNSTMDVSWSRLPRCLFFSPHIVPTVPYVGIVSSRLGRRLDQQPNWFQAFRGACDFTKVHQATLVTARSTTTARFESVASRMYCLRHLSIVPPRPGETLEKWFRKLLKIACQAPTSDLCGGSGEHLLHRLTESENPLVYPAGSPANVWMSPVLSAEQPSALADSPSSVPLQDESIVAMSDFLFVVHLRRGGNTDRLIRARLQSAENVARPVFVHRDTQLIPADLAQELIDQGALSWEPASQTVSPSLGTRVGWHKEGDWTPFRCGPLPKPPQPEGSSHLFCAKPVARAAILTEYSAGAWPYLSHSTRGMAGPWPDQTELEYFDELLSGRPVEQRTPWASLRRILIQQCLWAGNRGIRGGTPVVCFTELPVSELPARRVFRQHRGRWDFEPYGICIRRDWLEEHGTRAVIYGDEATWSALEHFQRPFFQLHQSQGANSPPTCDWSVEREWRHVGNISVADLPVDAGLVFVPTRAEAEQLAAYSRWPILVVGNASPQGRTNK